MTRIFTDGAEMADALFFSNSGSVTAAGAAKCSGDYGYSFAGAGRSCYKTVSTISECYFKHRIRISSTLTPPTTARHIGFRAGTTELAYVCLDSILRWILVVGGVTVATSTEVASISTWYCMEVYYKIDAVAGVFTLRIDGNQVCTFSGDTLVASDTDFDNVWWRNGTTGTLGFDYIDDIAFNDTAGGVDDSWIGGGRIIKVTPDGNGAASEWTGNDGNAVDNYLLVDEYPLDSDTTYVYEDASETGDLDQYTLSDYDGTDRTITRIYAECRARKTAVEAATLKIGFDTGTSVNTDDVGVLYETYSIRLVGAEYALNPDDAAAWEEADIDALEFVAEVG
jgi:hypothetical protein